MEGIFRLAGSEKRIKELKTAFDTPPRYGKGLDWTGYTVHDAANILRRYFNNLPEPIIPLQHYDPFRQPLRGHQAEAVGHIEGQQPSLGGFDPDAVVRIYQHLIKSLPSLNRQLLLYILDLLAVFAAKADINKMTTHNLAAIFQPGILSHPQHDMSPSDYRLSQDVLIFLIDNQDHFLIGMEGTAVDEGTVKHVESGPPTPQPKGPVTPGRSSSGIGRSASTSSSAGAESLRKTGGVRRNVSTSSKRSRHSNAVPSPITPVFTTPSASGVHRSNTLPSKRSPALGSPRFTKETSGSSTPVGEDSKATTQSPLAAEAAAIVASLGQTSTRTPPPSEGIKSAPTAPPAPIAVKEPEVEPEQTIPKRAMTLPPQKIDLPQAAPFAPIPQNKQAAITLAIDRIPGGFPLPSPEVIPPSEDVTPNATAQNAAELLPQPVPAAAAKSPHHTPTRERPEFIEGPVDTGPAAEPSAATRTFTQMLSKVAASPSSDGRKPNKLQKKRLPGGAIPSAQSSTHSLTGGDSIAPGQQSPLQPPQPPFAHGYAQASGSKEALPSYNNDTVSSRNSGTTLKPSMSPSASFRSHSTATEYSEADPNEEAKDEKRSFWKAHKRGDSRATPTASQTDLHGSVPGADKSMSSFGSGSGAGAGSRRSLQYDSQRGPDVLTTYGSPPDQDRPEKKGGISDWFHKMRQDHKERSDKKERAKSPPGSSNLLPAPQNLMSATDGHAGRGRSMDIPRSTAEPSRSMKPAVTGQQQPVTPPSSSTPAAASSSPQTITSASGVQSQAAAVTDGSPHTAPPVTENETVLPVTRAIATEPSLAQPTTPTKVTQPVAGASTTSAATPADVASPTAVDKTV